MGERLRDGRRASYLLDSIVSQKQERFYQGERGRTANDISTNADQSLNRSLRENIPLAEPLRRGRSEWQHPGPRTLLQHYLDGQTGDQAATVAFSHYLTQLFSNRNPVLVAGRNAGLLAMDLLPLLKIRLARQCMGLRG